ncbi:transposase [Christensenellaceae bacterium OttesenSCG-928-M15]|nr:transposase [Christensenellaceae bacterium OttesenSCG-928-M15]
MKSAARQAEIPQGQHSEITQLKTRIVELETLVKYYEAQLLLAKRRQFGASSEKMDCCQISLFADAELTAPAEPEVDEASPRPRKRKGKREEDLSGLPALRVDYELAEQERLCPQCGEAMRDIGVDVRRELELIPARVIVKEHAVHAYACVGCTKNSTVTPMRKAQGLRPLLSGSLASASLVAYIATQKYMNAMPLYRLENGFRLDGVYISRQNMANWVIKCSELYLEAIYLRMKEDLLKELVLHADETVFQVLRELGRAAQSKSYEWIYRTGRYAGKKITIYEYQETRSRAHARRKWENLLKTIPKEKRANSDAARGMAYFNALYGLEHAFEGLSPEERRERRLEKSKPIADAFFAWAEGLGALPKSSLGEAVHYALSQRKYLNHIFLDGRFIEFLLTVLPNSTTSDLEQYMPWSNALPDYCRAPQRKGA